VLIPLVLILIPLLLSFTFRIQPAYLPVTDDWAENSVHNSIQSTINNQINKDYPNLPDANKQALINEQFQQFLKDNKEQVNSQIEQTSDYFKSTLQDEDGHTYLLAIDPYTFYRQTRNLITKGHVWDKEVNGTVYNDHMIAPLGVEVKKKFLGGNLHVWIEYLFFRISALFKSITSENLDRELMHAVFYVPVIISMLAVIPAFFIGRKFGGNFGGFITAFLVAIHPAFINRTAGGFADTDAYNVLFPLIIVALFLFSLDAKKRGYILAGIAGFFTGLYAFAWTGWWIPFDLVVATTLIVGGYSFYKKNEHFKKYFNILAVFIISSLLFVTLFSGFSNFSTAFTQPISRLKLKEVTHPTLWPNVLRTVAELNQASLDKIVNTMGGGLLMLISFAGIVILFFKKKINAGILFLLWFVGMVYTSTQGIRFTLLLVPVFAIGIGVAFGWLYKNVSRWLTKELKINKIVSKITLIVVLLLFIGITPIPSGAVIPFCNMGLCKQASIQSNQEIPSMNDAWYDSLIYIKENSSKDAIINSWWDFGHWFKAIGDRAVTFDGASQNSPMAHWIGRALLTSNEKEAVGILRMLDCGSNNTKIC